MSDETLISTFTEMRRKFLQLASRFLNNEDDANDALQDAFCRLWPRRNEIHSRQEAEALTVTTVKNLCIDTLRKQKKKDTVALEQGREICSLEQTDEQMERKEQFLTLQQIINLHLTETQRIILQRKEYEGESIDAIAQSLHMQTPAVRMQLSRARKTIRECYQKLNEK